jgi:uncharacterized protein HemX
MLAGRGLGHFGATAELVAGTPRLVSAGTERVRRTFSSRAQRKEEGMATWIWILTAVAVVVVVGLAIVGGAQQRRRKQVEERREQAQQLREEADSREKLAREHEEHARNARQVAAEVGARADRIDPDRETPADG